LVENNQSGSADGISLAFLGVWAFGDLLNFFGAFWAGLVPTVVALAIYFCIADTILIAQCLYYKSCDSDSKVPDQIASEDLIQPLLPHTSSDIGLPGSRRPSIKCLKSSEELPTLPISPGDRFSTNPWIKNIASVVFVCAVGTTGWAFAWQIGVWKPAFEDTTGESLKVSAGAASLGYLSAICYLGFVIFLPANPRYLTQSCSVRGYLKYQKIFAKSLARVSLDFPP